MMKKIYICSPLRGDIKRNLEYAQQYAKYVVEQGHIPIVPHLFFATLLNDEIPEQRQCGLRIGLELLKFCDELWIFGETISDGMAAEIEFWKQEKNEHHAIKRGINTPFNLQKNI